MTSNMAAFFNEQFMQFISLLTGNLPSQLLQELLQDKLLAFASFICQGYFLAILLHLASHQ